MPLLIMSLLFTEITSLHVRANEKAIEPLSGELHVIYKEIKPKPKVPLHVTSKRPKMKQTKTYNITIPLPKSRSFATSDSKLVQNVKATTLDKPRKSTKPTKTVTVSKTTPSTVSKAKPSINLKNDISVSDKISKQRASSSTKTKAKAETKPKLAVVSKVKDIQNILRIPATDDATKKRTSVLHQPVKSAKSTKVEKHENEDKSTINLTKGKSSSNTTKKDALISNIKKVVKSTQAASDSKKAILPLINQPKSIENASDIKKGAGTINEQSNRKTSSDLPVSKSETDWLMVIRQGYKIQKALAKPSTSIQPTTTSTTEKPGNVPVALPDIESKYSWSSHFSEPKTESNKQYDPYNQHERAEAKPTESYQWRGYAEQNDQYDRHRYSTSYYDKPTTQTPGRGGFDRPGYDTTYSSYDPYDRYGFTAPTQEPTIDYYDTYTNKPTSVSKWKPGVPFMYTSGKSKADAKRHNSDMVSQAPTAEPVRIGEKKPPPLITPPKVMKDYSVPTSLTNKDIFGSSKADLPQISVARQSSGFKSLVSTNIHTSFQAPGLAAVPNVGKKSTIPELPTADTVEASKPTDMDEALPTVAEKIAQLSSSVLKKKIQLIRKKILLDKIQKLKSNPLALRKAISIIKSQRGSI